MEIVIDKTPGRQKIQLMSEDGDINKATAEIYQILLGMVIRERNSKELELFAKQVNDNILCTVKCVSGIYIALLTICRSGNRDVYHIHLSGGLDSGYTNNVYLYKLYQ